jgi:hypothetical protein
VDTQHKEESIVNSGQPAEDGKRDSLPAQQPRVTPQTVKFANKRSATVVVPPATTPMADIISALGLGQPGDVLLIVGDAAELEAEVEAQLIQLFSRGLARAAADANARLVDNGRQTSISAITGRGVADRGYKSPLVGVAPAAKIAYPGDSAQGEALEAHHSHFVLTEGDEWGDETEALFQFVEALAGPNQVVVVLVNGGETAKEQILQSVRQGWPVIIIRGSGGLADEIADLWQKRPPFIADPALAEIIVEGKLHFFQLGVGSIGEFERRLEQLLHFKEADTISTLELMWQRFAEYDQNAKRQQRSFTRVQSSILTLGVVATLLAITEFLFKNGFDMTIPSYFYTERAMYYVLLIIPIVIALLTTAANRFSAGTKWILLRASAESIKKEIYRYRTRTEIYSDRATKKTSREVKLEQKSEILSRKLMQTEVNISAINPYNGPIPPLNAAAPGDDGLSFLTPERYMTYRLQDQLGWYRNRTVKLEKRLKRLQWLIWGAGAVGTFLVAVGLELWIALTTSIVTALTTYLEYQQVENTLMRYNQTATDLENVRSWWISLSAEEQADPRNIDKLVGQTETTIHSEHAAWVQEMQDAMAELRAEQSGEDTDDESDGSTTKVETGSLLITNVNR